MKMQERVFTVEELRLLVEMEREMDAGRIPWVYVEGTRQRASMDPAIMEQLGLVTGQTISGVIFTEILRLKIKQCEEEIAYKNLLRDRGLLAEGEP